MDQEKRLILFVEDSPTQAIGVQHILESTNRYNVTLAEDAVNAIELLQESPLPDAIVSDIQMPVMDGFEFVAFIRSDKRLRHIPVLLATSESYRDNMLKGLICGANCFVEKPLNKSLIPILDFVIENNELQVSAKDGTTLIKAGDEIYNINNDKTQIIDMLYAAIIMAEDKTAKLEYYSKELKEAKNSLSNFQNNKKTAKQTASPIPNIKILIVDDTNINRVICSRLLDSLGFSHEVAESAEEVIDLMKTRYNEFDMIFSDCQMPGMDGFEMTRKIRGLEKENNFSQKPIIALTANIHKDDHGLCYESGMNDVLNKPFRKEDIDHCIRKWLKQVNKNQKE